MATSSQFIPASKSQLDFFRPRLVQTSQTGYETIPLKPINSYSKTSKRLEFFHPGKGTDFYRNLSNTFFYFKFKISTVEPKTEAGGVPAAKTKYAVINYLAQTIISSIEIALNGTVITRNTENYGYRAYIESLITRDKTDEATHLATCGFYLDSGNNPAGNDFVTNVGMLSREALVKDGAQVEFISRLHGDIFNSNLYLPQGIDLAINLNLNPDNFLIMASKELSATQYGTFELEDCTMYTEICHINPAVMNAQARIFQDHNAVYPLQHVEVHSITRSKASMAMSIDNVFNGRLPSVMLIGLVDNSAYAGHYLKNPFAFKHLNMTGITVSVNGVPHRVGPLNFDNELNVMGYQSLLKSTGLLAQNESPMISLDMFRKGYCLFGFDLSAEGSSGGHGTHTSLQPVGNVRLDFTFKADSTDPVTFIIYAIFEGSVMEIDKNRNVFISW